MRYIKEGLKLCFIAVILSGVLVGTLILSNYLHYNTFLF